MEIGLWLLDVLASAAAAAVLVSALAWISREWISTRLTASVRLETERELAELRSRLESAEQHVRDVRQAGIEGARSTNAAVIAERVTATKELARLVIEWRSMATLSILVGVMTPEIAARTASERAMQETLGKMWDASSVGERLNHVAPLAAWRPFVTESACALFAAFQGFYVARMTKAMAIRTGNVELVRRLWVMAGERKIVSAVAPELLDSYDRNPAEIEGAFVEKLSNDLLAELKRGLSGEHGGAEAMRQAVAITSTTDRASGELRQVQSAKSLSAASA
jgi:hypothetical protein